MKMNRIITWDLMTPYMIKQSSRFCGSLHSLSGPKTFYKLYENENIYIITIDENRDEIVSVVNQETKEVEYSHPLARHGKKIMENMKGLGIDFGF
jgi:hypothetical protein